MGCVMRRGLLLAVVLLVGAVACFPRRPQRRLTAEEQECREILQEADIRRTFRNAGNVAAGRPEETGPLDPCALGCRIPRCGYPAGK
jgi:hypothetical protein